MPQPTSIVVTGGAGFIGRHIVATLALLGYKVISIDNYYRGTAKGLIQSPNVTHVTRDITDAAHLETLFRGAKVLINLAAVSSVRIAEANANLTYKTNTVALMDLVKAARKAGVEYILQASSREVFGNPQYLPVDEAHPLGGINVYGLSKERAEQQLSKHTASYGVPYTPLRLANVIGSGDKNDGRVIPKWLSQAREGKALTVIGGTNKVIDFVPVSVVTEAFVRLMHLHLEGNGFYEPILIGSGKPTTLQQLAERIGSHYPVALDFQPAAQAVEVDRFYADTSRMQTVLGLTPPDDPLLGIENFTFMPQ